MLGSLLRYGMPFDRDSSAPEDNYCITREHKNMCIRLLRTTDTHEKR